jgi:hypothetical protein
MINEETKAVQGLMSPMLAGLDQGTRRQFVNGFKRAVQEHASKIIEREAFRDTNTEEEEIQACIVQLVAALGLIATVNRVDWDKISEPELKVVK